MALHELVMALRGIVEALEFAVGAADSYRGRRVGAFLQTAWLGGLSSIAAIAYRPALEHKVCIGSLPVTFIEFTGRWNAACRHTRS